MAPRPPVGVAIGAEKFPPPWFNRTLTVPQPPALITTISSLLSPLKSARRTDMGEFPAEIVRGVNETGCAPKCAAANSANKRRFKKCHPSSPDRSIDIKKLDFKS